MARIALFQMTSGIDPEANNAAILDAIDHAAAGGATMLFTPEMCGLLDKDRKRASKHIVAEVDNILLKDVRKACCDAGIWCVLGSIAIALEEGGYANRSFVITDKGEIAARYDKIHMFDVELDSGESWMESSTYCPGNEVVTVDTPIGKLGLTICYDIRFPALFERLGQQSCDVISIPAAFTVPTGRDHWHILQRARAIEGTAFVVAAAQNGLHADGRETFGHSLVVDPWGDVVLDMGKGESLSFADLDVSRIEEVRRQLPSLANRRRIGSTVS